MNNIMKLATQEQEYMVKIRRELHEHPELSLQEQWTSNKICDELKAMGIPYVIAGNYGIIATLEGGNTDNMVALRADMDALPIQENNPHLPYQSKIPNVMHACGHDSHVAMLLGAAKVLSQVKDQIQGTVKLCFQQAEEIGAGAQEILAELDPFPIKSTFGIHIWSEIESGAVAVEPGPRMSRGRSWQVTFKGKGTHGAIPEDGISPIIAGSSFVNSLNSAINYEISPLKTVAITIGIFQAGEAGNVIPEEALISGTTRTFYPEDNEQASELITRVAQGTAQTYGTEVDISFSSGCPPVVNDAHCTDIAQESVKSLLGADGLANFHQLMPSENYGFYVEKYPGLMAFVGGKNDKKSCNYAHHHPCFNIDEDALSIGAALHTQYTIDYLKQLYN